MSSEPSEIARKWAKRANLDVPINDEGRCGYTELVIDEDELAKIIQHAIDEARAKDKERIALLEETISNAYTATKKSEWQVREILESIVFSDAPKKGE